jgi:hypothetical protein
MLFWGRLKLTSNVSSKLAIKSTSEPRFFFKKNKGCTMHGKILINRDVCTSGRAQARGASTGFFHWLIPPAIAKVVRSPAGHTPLRLVCQQMVGFAQGKTR